MVLNVADVTLFVKLKFAGFSVAFDDDVTVTTIWLSGCPYISRLDFLWLMGGIEIAGTVKTPFSQVLPL